MEAGGEHPAGGRALQRHQPQGAAQASGVGRDPGGINASPRKMARRVPRAGVTQALLILKFGGVLTHLGKNQAEFLGRDFRMRMYPGGDPNSDGLLRLHSTYRHDLNIYRPRRRSCADHSRRASSLRVFWISRQRPAHAILASLVNKDAKLLDFVTRG